LRCVYPKARQDRNSSKKCERDNIKRAIKRVIKNKGGPLSPILSNIVLDELDKELEKRGLCFVRYADDCVIFVRSKRAGDRVMQSVSPAESGAEGKPGKERRGAPVGP